MENRLENKIDNKTLALILGAIFAALIIGTIIASKQIAYGGGGFMEKICSITTATRTPIGIGNVRLLATSGVRAWASIQVEQPGATSTSYLSFNQDIPVGLGTSTYLNASSTPKIEFGRNTNFPYTGSVRGQTDTGSTTVFVTECTYGNP